MFVAFISSPKGFAFGQRVAMALTRAGISQKEAAITMGLSVQRLSEAVNGKSPLSLHRLAELPDAFHAEFDRLGVEQRGGAIVVQQDLWRLIEGVDKLVMARCELPTSSSALHLMMNPLGEKAKVS